MAQFTIRGEVAAFGAHQHNIRVENGEDLRQFWNRESIDTDLDWSGFEPVLVTVSAQALVAKCNPGDEVEYMIETWDRTDGRRIRGIDLQVIHQAQ